jgi:hypothetical protein
MIVAYLNTWCGLLHGDDIWYRKVEMEANCTALLVGVGITTK